MAETALTSSQKERYKICTKTILESLNAQFDGGIALIEVRDHKLYVEEFETFEAYCKEVLSISKSRAYQLIEAAQVKESLPEKAGEKITNERQARALVDVPENKRAEVIREASKSGDLTAASIEAVVSQMSTVVDKDQSTKSRGSSKRPDEFDEAGTVIPDEAIPFWHRRQEVQDMLTQISKLKGFVEQAKEHGDVMYSKVPNAFIAHLSTAYAHLSEAKPYAVCTHCNGAPSAQKFGCEYCGSSGLISKVSWDVRSKKEVKEMRSKINAARAAA